MQWIHIRNTRTNINVVIWFYNKNTVFITYWNLAHETSLTPPLFIYMRVPSQESDRSCICLFYLFICVCQARKVIGHVFFFFIYLYVCAKHKKVISHVFLFIIMGYQFCFFQLFWYLVLPFFRQCDICCFRFITSMKILYTNTILHAEIWPKRVIPIHVFMVTILSKLKVISISYVFVHKVVVIN